MNDVRYTVAGTPIRGTIVAFAGADGSVDHLCSELALDWQIVTVDTLGAGSIIDVAPHSCPASSSDSHNALPEPRRTEPPHRTEPHRASPELYSSPLKLGQTSPDISADEVERALHFAIARIEQTHDHGVVLMGSGRGAELAARVAQRIPQAIIALVLDCAPARVFSVLGTTDATAVKTAATTKTPIGTHATDAAALASSDAHSSPHPVAYSDTDSGVTPTAIPTASSAVTPDSALVSEDHLDAAAVVRFLDAVYPESREAQPYIEPELLDIIRQSPTPAHITIGQARERSEQFYQPVELPQGFSMRIQQLSSDSSRSFETRLICGEGNVGAVLFVVHGGGYVAGTAKGEDIRCVELIHDFSAYVWPEGDATSDTAAKTFLSVTPDYALAPEFPHPAGLRDTLTALRWTFAEFPHLPVILYGDSAGSGMIRQLLHHLDEGELAAISGVIALEPCLSPRMDTASFAAYRNALSWTKESAENAWEAYGMTGARAAVARLREAGMDSVRAAEQGYGLPTPPIGSVGLEEVEPPITHLSPNFPATLIVINPADTLRDEGIAWFTHLADLGANVQIHSYPGTLHGWLSASGTHTWERVRRDLRPFVAEVIAHHAAQS
ncbi:MAG: alpha/beta hydrolase fold domain-containing protein [Actinomycetaceae bacterium]|nr:alpha/beta hydrolase fold domain-containing protein [Actinomycetaceae bacterium]MDY5854257.1 alpha/beta hydrolase fold domain-containing protein [Arcanobacterium sp.]